MSENGAVREVGAELEAGRELDALVAEKVMGITGIRQITVIGATVTQEPGWSGKSYQMPDGRMGRPAYVVPRYSSDIAAAWLVVERLAETGLWVSLCDMRHGCYTEDGAPWRGWFAEICDVEQDEKFGPCVVSHEFSEHPWSASAPTAPLAICKAALQAVARATLTNSEDRGISATRSPEENEE